MLARLVERRTDLVAILQIERDPSAVIGIERLHDDRISEAGGCARGRFGGADHALARNGKPQIGKNAIRFLLVGGDGYRDVTGLRGDRGLNALLVLAVAELNQALVVEAHPRNVARFGGANEGSGGRAKLASLREVHELDELCAEVERRFVFTRSPLRAKVLGEQVVQKLDGQIGRGFAYALFFELEHHVVDADGSGASGLAENDVGAGEVLELDGDVLEHVAEPGAAVLREPTYETARALVGARVGAQGGHGLEKTVDEARDLGAGPVFERAEIDRETHDGEVRVEAWAAVNAALR